MSSYFSNSVWFDERAVDAKKAQYSFDIGKHLTDIKHVIPQAIRKFQTEIIKKTLLVHQLHSEFYAQAQKDMSWMNNPDTLNIIMYAIITQSEVEDIPKFVSQFFSDLENSSWNSNSSLNIIFDLPPESGSVVGVSVDRFANYSSSVVVHLNPFKIFERIFNSNSYGDPVEAFKSIQKKFESWNDSDNECVEAYAKNLVDDVIATTYASYKKSFLAPANLLESFHKILIRDSYIWCGKAVDHQFEQTDMQLTQRFTLFDNILNIVLGSGASGPLASKMSPIAHFANLVIQGDAYYSNFIKNITKATELKDIIQQAEVEEILEMKRASQANINRDRLPLDQPVEFQQHIYQYLIMGYLRILSLAGQLSIIDKFVRFDNSYRDSRYVEEYGKKGLNKILISLKPDKAAYQDIRDKISAEVDAVVMKMGQSFTRFRTFGRYNEWFNEQKDQITRGLSSSDDYPICAKMSEDDRKGKFGESYEDPYFLGTNLFRLAKQLYKEFGSDLFPIVAELDRTKSGDNIIRETIYNIANPNGHSKDFKTVYTFNLESRQAVMDLAYGVEGVYGNENGFETARESDSVALHVKDITQSLRTWLREP